MTESVEATDEDDGGQGEHGKRQRSTIAFPYNDYDAAAEVAQSIHSNVGHGTCSATSQLAAWMKQSAKSSGFRTQLAAARLFGLIDSDNTETYRLTPLGIKLVDPGQARAAKAEAFLKVPLFAAIFEKYKGTVTPPDAALEREIVGLGVSEKQKARARQVFESSAKQTGFREQGPTHLVMPAVVVTGTTRNEMGSGGSTAVSGGVQVDGGATSIELKLDPLLIALLQKIPGKGEDWPSEKRLRWFKTFAMNVSQVYDNDSSPVELDIRVEKQLQDPPGR